MTTPIANFSRICNKCGWTLRNTEVEDCPLCHTPLTFRSEKIIE